MGKQYCHIQPQDRLKIHELLFKGYAIIDIAKAIHVDRSTLYRELARNSCKLGYRPDWASQQYLTRRQKRPTKLDRNPELKAFVIEKLKQGWSPDAISGRLKKQAGHCIISRETIYRYIYSQQGMRLKLHCYLQKKRCFRYPRIKRRRKTIINARKTPIREREEVINKRQSFGHWEGDLVLFSKQKTNLITLRERKSRVIVAIKNQTRKAKKTTKTIIKHMGNSLNKSIKSLTLDNDPSFSEFESLGNSLNARIYFCEPYKSYQKGAIENANKLIRTRLPRKTYIREITQKQIDNIMNNY